MAGPKKNREFVEAFDLILRGARKLTEIERRRQRRAKRLRPEGRRQS